jgi:hypothetical protein
MFVPNSIDPRDLKLEVRQRMSVDRMYNFIKQCHEILVVMRNQGMEMVFNNDLGLTPEEFQAGMGADFLEIVKLRELLDATIEASAQSVVLEE